MREPEPFLALPGGALAPGVRLPVARYRFTFRMRDGLRLPGYAGSLLRGQFGAALRRTACMTLEKRCEPCPLLRTCPYPAIFQTPAPASHPLQRFTDVPNPYVVEPPPMGTRVLPPGDRLEFGLVLVGRALEQLPLVAYAFQRAFRVGVAKVRARAELESIELQAHGAMIPVWDPESARILEHDHGLVVPRFENESDARLEFVTPLRLQHQGTPLQAQQLHPRTLVTALMRRGSLLFELHAGIRGLAENAPALAAQAQALQDERRLEWRDWTRYSSRQHSAMTLGGVVGQWTLRGDLTVLLPWLWLGQWLHAGKNATMGLGRYELRVGGK